MAKRNNNKGLCLTKGSMVVMDGSLQLVLSYATFRPLVFLLAGKLDALLDNYNTDELTGSFLGVRIDHQPRRRIIYCYNNYDANT